MPSTQSARLLKVALFPIIGFFQSSRPMYQKLALAVALCAAAGAFLVYQAALPAPGTRPIPEGASGELLEGLRVSEPEFAVRYDRNDWNHWTDADGDGCNTRFEVLIEESVNPVQVEAGCFITGGIWVSPFDGAVQTTPTDVDVDHLVPLANAHRSGGWAWTDADREFFANYLVDSNHLVAVTDEVNQEKGDSGPEKWRPSDRSSWCWYAESWIDVKATWSLSVTHAERDALAEMLETCTP